MTRRIFVAVGTRPEVVKLAPVIRALQARADRFEVVVCAAGQHQDVPAWLRERGLRTTLDLVVNWRHDLSAQLADLTEKIAAVLKGDRVDLVLVEGDTTTTLGAALAALYQGIPVGHVEAGLRTGNPAEPFPEEMHRRLVTQVATLHFCPTWRALGHVQRERPDAKARGRAWLTGNPVVDELNRECAALWGSTSAPLAAILAEAAAPSRLSVLVTCHRREAWDERLGLLIRAVVEMAERMPDVDIVWPLHPNPRIAAPVRQATLGTYANVRACYPLPYRQFLAALRSAAVVVTDSGGVIEEAVTLGRRTLIIRDETERPEAVEVGAASLVPVSAMKDLPRLVEEAMASPVLGPSEVFGDGWAGERIASLVERWLALPESWR
jgi:UDP-N-acetylglucosamine 2-epimerase (non-hydrolysing)